jgi:hypothetical protein
VPKIRSTSAVVNYDLFMLISLQGQGKGGRSSGEVLSCLDMKNRVIRKLMAIFNFTSHWVKSQEGNTL